MDSDIDVFCEFNCGVGNVGWWSGGGSIRKVGGSIILNPVPY